MINVELPLSSVGGTLLKHLEEHAVQGSRWYCTTTTITLLCNISLLSGWWNIDR